MNTQFSNKLKTKDWKLNFSGHRGWLAAAILTMVLITAVQMFRLWPQGSHAQDLSDALGNPADLVDGTVIATQKAPCQGSNPDESLECTSLKIRLTNGAEKGKIISIDDPKSSRATKIEKGDRLVLGYTPEAPEGLQYYFADFQRKTPLFLLAVLFCVCVLVLARWSGFRALLGVLLSLIVITKFMLPSMLDGNNPVEVATVSAAILLLVSLYFAHGTNIRTTIAVLGTLFSLGITTILAYIFVNASSFTGLSSEEATFIDAFTGTINLQGLLLAGMVIGALGVLDDVTVTQVSAIDEIRAANPNYNPVQLYKAALRIGRDHIASTVNTLVLAYAGASLPLLIVFAQANRQLAEILTGEIIAVEIVRTLVGSIGLIAAVPITTALAALILHDEPVIQHDVT